MIIHGQLDRWSARDGGPAETHEYECVRIQRIRAARIRGIRGDSWFVRSRGTSITFCYAVYPGTKSEDGAAVGW